MFEVSKYKKSNVKISIRLPENMNETLKKIAKKENMSFNNVIVSCIQNSLDEMDLNKYKNLMKNPIVLDGRNCYNLNEVAKLDIKYYSIGR